MIHVPHYRVLDLFVYSMGTRFSLLTRERVWQRRCGPCRRGVSCPSCGTFRAPRPRGVSSRIWRGDKTRTEMKSLIPEHNLHHRLKEREKRSRHSSRVPRWKWPHLALVCFFSLDISEFRCLFIQLTKIRRKSGNESSCAP